MITEAAEMARSLDDSLGRILPVDALLAAAESDTPLPDAVQCSLVGLGWTGVALSEADGGFGLDPRDLVKLGAVAGRRLLPAAIRGEALILAPLLARAGRAAELEALLAGELRGGGGRGAVVALAPAAALAGVLEPAAIVPADGAEPFAALDRGQGFARVSGGDPVAGADPIRRTWELWVLGELYGCAQRALELAAEYATERRQFGRAIVGYQAVSHRLAAMAVDLEALDAAIGRLAGGDDERLAAVLRHAVPAAARRVVEGAIQVHGGMGFTWELGLHLHYRRALDLQAELGGADATLEALGAMQLGG